MTPVKPLPFGLSFKSIAYVISGILVVGASAEVVSTTSCAPAATNNPLRSFEDARDIDVVCMQTLNTEDGGGIPAKPLPQAECAPVPSGVAGNILTNHLFALVTQVKRGEVAVVDLTAGVVINEDLGTPGVNFLPVGQLPTGIASAPDGRMSYVAAAEVNKPAIYALPSTRILGNSQALEAGSPLPALLTTWPVCALPQTPGPISIIPNPPPEPSSGTADAGDAGAAESTTNPAGYVLAVVLPGTQEGVPARIITVDPMPLLRGAGLAVDGGGGGGGDGGGDADINPPGQLTPCKILGESVLSNNVADAAAGPVWPDGVKWLDAGLDAAVPSSAACAKAVVPDSGTGLPPLPNLAPQPTAAARAGQYLYVADGALPLIHVFDMTVPAHPTEIAPLRATSLAQPNRAVTISTLAISPPTRDYQRFLYAVDATDSPPSIIVYDITDPVNSPHVPQRRPHSNLVPLQPEDRINFTAGVSALAFVQHDWPLAQTPGGALVSGAATSGLLCNPNPNVDKVGLDASADAQTFTDPGANYRYSSLAFADEPLGPTRLRGIFAFATLSSGQVMTIDVDDWDAPCRRPQLMEVQDAGNDARTNGYTNAITPPEPAPSPQQGDAGELGPYEAPFTGVTNGVTWVSDEVFFPISEPHRPRSNFLLSNNTSLGLHFPYVVTAPQLYSAGPDGGLGASVTGSIAAGNPVLLPTATIYPDPSMLPDGGIGVRLAFEDPLAHIDQNWTIDYEGTLVTVANIPGQLSLTGEGLSNSVYPNYETLFVSVPGGTLCSKGVEDWTIGQQRVAAYLAEAKKQNLQAPEQMASWVGDYIQVADQLFPSTDAYWSSPGPNECWTDFGGTGTGTITDPTTRYNTCSQIFQVNGNETISLDFPIIQAFDDGFVITRFNYPENTSVPSTTSNRLITPPDPHNVAALKQLMCCFHGETTFNVRTGGEWVATGTSSGYLHHMTVDKATNRCVTSCDPEKALLNSRVLGIAPNEGSPDGGVLFTPDRDSVFAMRNPTFAYFIQHPFAADPNLTSDQAASAPPVVARPPRDDVWQFSLKGQLTPLSINLAATNSSVSPQSMLFIPSLGQLAIVDGSQQGQGLILIDLNAVAVTGNTYY